jgi:large subunit ribosomal protein L6
MSRIGRQPVSIPPGVKVALADGVVSVEGPKGALRQELPPGIEARLEDGRLVLERKDDTKEQKALHGLARALVANAVTGVTKGWQKELEIHGVGYRAQVSGSTVVFYLGHTHPVEFPIPEGVTISVDRQTRILVSGPDRQKVGQVAARIRALRPPDVYKQKGIRYAGEPLRKKAGKAAVKG